MRYELTEKGVIGAQNISNMCLVCGEGNGLGLHAQFLDLEDGSVCALFETVAEHQSYPGRVHGGVISAILDEAIGRAVQVREPEVFGVTMELTVKFRAPVPLGVPLKAVARVTKSTRRVFEGAGEIVLEDGTVAAQATARYARLPVDDISAGGLGADNWRVDERAFGATVLA